MIKTHRDANQKSLGFTIVELLIVIVVIGILAAITIIAYNGVQDRAKVAQMASGAELYLKSLSLYAADNNSYPIPTVSGSIGCFDGTTNCNGASTLALSTALLNGIKPYNSSIPLALPYSTTLLSYNSTADTINGGTYTGYYVLFSIPPSQTCPQNVAGGRFLNASVSGAVQSCRLAIPTP